MKKKLIMLLAFMFVLPCAVMLSACKQSKDASKKVQEEISGVALVENEFVYDGVQKRVTVDKQTLPENVRVKYISGDAYATDAGDYTAIVKLEYYGENVDTSQEIPAIELDWTILKANINVRVNEDVVLVAKYFSYEKDVERTVAINYNALPSYFSVKNISGTQSATNAGQYYINVELEYVGANAKNYNPIEPIRLDWQIFKKTLPISLNNIVLVQDDFTYDGTEKSIQVTGLPENVSCTIISGGKATIVSEGGYTAAIKLKYDGDDAENYYT